MASYNRIKSAKVSPIGTIMPWTGSSSSSALTVDAVPKGWITCSGQTIKASEYPLLAQLLGNTYGPFQVVGGPPVGIQNPYPLYEDTDLFTLPNLNQTALVDIESSRVDPADMGVIGAYVTENGADAAPLTNIVSYVDVNFSIETDGELAGKVTGLSIQDPVYFDTIRVIPRKLGVDHTPAHSHAQPETDKYPSTIIAGGYVGLFEAGNYDIQDAEWTTASAIAINPNESNADVFLPGTARVTWYDEAGQTLPDMSGWRDFTNSASDVPIIPSTPRVVAGYGNTGDPLNNGSYNDPNTCIINQQMPALTVPFPPAGSYMGQRNHYTTGSDVDVARTGGSSGDGELYPYPVTLNHQADVWNSESFGSHNHFTIDVSMNKGQMRVPSTVLINNMTTGTIAPVSVDKALSVQVNPNTPSLTTLIIMRAY